MKKEKRKKKKERRYIHQDTDVPRSGSNGRNV